MVVKYSDLNDIYNNEIKKNVKNKEKSLNLKEIK